MAGTVTHLVIADQLLKPLQIKNPALFYCGNLAPDAIMARKNYVREMKRHTHFKDGISLNELHQPENYAVYRELFSSFRERFLKQEEADYELYLGYVTHILTDELFILTVRDDFVKMLRSQKLSLSDPDHFEVFSNDVNQNDWYLVREYSFAYPMPEILLQEQNYEIPGYITNAELRDSKQFIIHRNFETPHAPEASQIYTLDIHMRFLSDAVTFICEQLKSF